MAGCREGCQKWIRSRLLRSLREQARRNMFLSATLLAEVLSVLTLTMSGIWPHVKLFMLLFAWVMPPRSMSKKMRERILRFLDMWGKYGFLESWFLIHSMSAFAIEWESVGSNASLKLVTTPAVAFYSYFAATVLAIMLGNVASEFNNSAHASPTSCASQCLRQRAQRPGAAIGGIGEAGQGDKNSSAAAPASECSSTTSPASEPSPTSESEVRRPLSAAVSKTRRLSVACALAASVVLGVGSALLISFEFTVSGFFVDFLLSHPIDKQHSLLTVGEAVAAGKFDDVGLIILEVAFFLLSFAIPLALLASLMCLWLLPLTMRKQRRLVRVSHLLDSWACLDVAVLVTIVALFQYGIMARFLVYQGNFATPCTMIKDLTKDECLDIQMHAEPGIVVVILAGLALLIVPKVAMRQAEAALDSGEKLGDIGRAVDEGPMAEAAEGS